MVLKTRFFVFLFFCQKTQNFVLFGPYEFVQISLARGTNFIEECMDRCWTSIVSISNGSTEDFLKANLLQKRLSDLTFYVTIADADIESLKSLRTLFGRQSGPIAQIGNIAQMGNAIPN